MSRQQVVDAPQRVVVVEVLDQPPEVSVAGEISAREDFYSFERKYLDAGIHSVPAVIINDQHLISGGQPPQVFERALRQIAGAAQATTAVA